MAQRNNNNARRRHIREGRLEIVAHMYKRGCPIQAIANEVRARLNTTCSKATVWNDIRLLLNEWREARLTDTDDRVQLELAKIDEAERELWEQWEKSKEDYDRVNNTRRGQPVTRGDGSGNTEIQTYDVAEQRTNVVGLGDPRYIAEIRQQQIERRKLLGLYAPEKREIAGGVTFTSLLMESGSQEDDDAEEIAMRMMV